ncbi:MULTISPECIES: YbaB/EbfC family nucleoid-associated protein [Glycomyces]|uniref:DNA-binding protein YbaB n=2 Tax=Glycomyces TaxID=58113 RepID=A0A9X3PIR9_9ACTN|nr:YbaB/EbfC family nucleoid-associated protein [Glycomyces lechevalierae]MDA1384536.1 YbaB/EbfC family nucleoid-associated protein [Glycomyces lechevalierae]MDR7338175.1 DNA-binding protein YbaB [Glycomyces lechevalierae]
MHGDINGRIAAVQQMAAELRAEAVSEGGAVRVVAGPGGEVKEIDLRLNAFEMSGVELGELTAATVKRATADADRRLSEEIRGVVGDVFGAAQEEQL